MEKDSYQTLLSYAFWLLGRKSYSESEITRRIFRRGKKLRLSGLAQAAKKTVKRLRQLKYIDDERLIDDYFEYRLKSRPVGKFAFLHEMHRRGIPIDKARESWEKRDIAEEPLAAQLIESQKQKLIELPLVLRKKKIISLLVSRGFAPDTVWGVIDRL